MTIPANNIPVISGINKELPGINRSIVKQITIIEIISKMVTGVLSFRRFIRFFGLIEYFLKMLFKVVF